MIVSKVGKQSETKSPPADLIRSALWSEGEYISSTLMRIIVGFSCTPFNWTIDTWVNRKDRAHARSFALVINMAREFAKQFYSSAAWQSCRNEYMKRAHYLCEDCLARGIYKPAKEVHHIEELTPANIHRPEIALNFDNLVALCKNCHKERHSERSKGMRYVFGADGKIILK